MEIHEARATFERELADIEAILDRLCRQKGLEADEADSFRSYARTKLIENSYQVIRKFAGRSTLKTYLRAVLANAYRDYRIGRWGKWRPSAVARRLGEAAVLLDRYMHRDGQGVQQAIRRVLSRGDVAASESQLRNWAARLPARRRPRLVRLDDANPVAAAEHADAGILADERDETRNTAVAALERALLTLPEQDQAILRLVYWEGVSVANVARCMQLEQKPLYRRIERNLRNLRSLLEAQGIGSAIIAEIAP